MQQPSAGGRSELYRAVATARLVVAAMIAGLLVFLGVVLANAREAAAEKAAGGSALITLLAAGTGLACAVAAATIPGKIGAAAARRARGRPDGPRQMAQAWLTRTLVACALIEGGALFNAVAHMLEGRPLSLVVCGLLILAIAFLFPSVDRAAQWVSSHFPEAARGPFDGIR